MLSRRNIRIKVMQLHYAKRLDETLDYKGMKSRFVRSIEQSYNLYLFNIWQLIRTTAFAKIDKEKRLAKYLPSEEDRRFSPIFYENELVQSMDTNEAFQKIIKERSIAARVDKDMSRLFYTEFAKTEHYNQYINSDSNTNEDHKQILLALYKFCINNETYNDYMEDQFDNWIHDKSLVIGAIKKTLKAIPCENDFYKHHIPSDEMTLEFGHDLLYKSIHFDEELLEWIKPALKNWEIDRVAVIDLILLKLALGEMLHFPTIPVKVTINEFVDISKIYSTPKSKDFINGILDKLMKKLTSSGDIQKEGRGLVD